MKAQSGKNILDKIQEDVRKGTQIEARNRWFGALGFSVILGLVTWFCHRREKLKASTAPQVNEQPAASPAEQAESIPNLSRPRS